MKVVYDPAKDILQISFADCSIEETTQISPGLILDYDKDGNLAGMEIRKASHKLHNPYAITYQVGEANENKPAIRERE